MMSTSCSIVGSMTTAGSLKSRVPFIPNSRRGMSMRKHDESVRIPGRVPMQCSAARRTTGVAVAAPATTPSTSPSRRHRAP